MLWFIHITQTVPQTIAALSWPLIRGWRWLWTLLIWGFFASKIIHPVDAFLNWTMALVLLVGLSWLSVYLPWDDINRAVAYVWQPPEQRRILKRVDKLWPTIALEAGLTRKGPDGQPVAPPLYQLEFNDHGQLVMRPGLAVGDTIESLESALELIRQAIGATQGRVRTDATRNRGEYVFTFHDPLTAMVTRELATPDGDMPFDEAVLGLTEDGEEWVLPLRTSTLTAGATGSGKGSVLWSMILAQGPNIATGLVQVHGIDLKGGMELSLGKPLFTRFATTATEAVTVLEDAATACQDRAHRLAGTTRLHTPTVDEPMVMLVIDELAFLVAYNNDRDLTRRAEAALSVILTQGRAVGYYVYGFLQDPRKEVLKLRNLFTQAVALRLNGSEEAAMMLSHEAVRAGARCQDISRKTPGVAYVIDETGIVTRVRATYVSDEQIREAAELFPAPVQIPIVVPEAAPEERRRTRAPRSAAA
ncbi:FtsK/SpoIIIE domain-containing protein [Luteococcus sediminum]